MSESCTHNCDTCGVDCPSRGQSESFLAPANEYSRVKKVIGVVSGKGGVGKSLVASLLAVQAQRCGYNAAILDADLTGPSIPQAFGIHERITDAAMGLYPKKTKFGTQIMSLNLLLANETDPVVWRGPVIAGMVKQFWTEVIWYNVDFMFVDMPPGTGDVPLTVFQSIPLDGIVIVATPQELVGMIVEKAVHMSELLSVPVIGIVENMGTFRCPDCGKVHKIFGESRVAEFAERFGIKHVSSLPLDPRLANVVDKGLIELFEDEYLRDMFEAVEAAPAREKPADEEPDTRLLQ